MKKTKDKYTKNYISEITEIVVTGLQVVSSVELIVWSIANVRIVDELI